MSHVDLLRTVLSHELITLLITRIPSRVEPYVPLVSMYTVRKIIKRMFLFSSHILVQFEYKYKYCTMLKKNECIVPGCQRKKNQQASTLMTNWKIIVSDKVQYMKKNLQLTFTMIYAFWRCSFLTNSTDMKWCARQLNNLQENFCFFLHDLYH